MSKQAPARYRTTNWPSYNASLKQRGNLLVWLDPGMEWFSVSRNKPGRPAIFSDVAIEFCLTMKSLFGLALRQTTGFVESLLRLLGLDWRVPDFSTLSRRQRTLNVQIPLQSRRECVHLLVDSTGIKMMGEGEWKVKKHGAEYRRQWRKLHLGVDAQNGEICALEVTDNRTNDASVVPTLLSQIPEERTISSVTGDGAYDTRNCHEAIAQRGAKAVIPTRRNASFWRPDKPGYEARNETLRAVKRLGRTIWKKWSGYHRRSLSETKMHCFKLLADKVKSKSLQSQITELRICAAILNRFTEMGTPQTVRIS